MLFKKAKKKKEKSFLRKGGSVELDFKQKLSTLRIPRGLFFSAPASPNCFSPAQIDRTVYKSVAFVLRVTSGKSGHPDILCDLCLFLGASNGGG